MLILGQMQTEETESGNGNGIITISPYIYTAIYGHVIRGVARIFKKRGQKCQVIAREARKIGVPEATPTPLNHVGAVC